MKQQAEDEKNNRRIGIAVSIGIHAVLLILFFFILAWKMPDPPPPGMPGMEINLGFVDAGMGDEQTNLEQVTEETPVEDPVIEEVPEEAILNEEKLITSNVETPHQIKETDKESKKEKTEPVKEKKEVIDSKNTFPNKKNSDSDGDKNVKGDQGKPEGDPDSRNMYPGKGNEKGNGPGGNGVSMELPGWEWDSKPDKVDPTSESGYVLFEFYVDEEGTVISAKKINGANLTPTEDNFYKKQLLETSFHLKDSKAKPAPRTRGVFRFEVRSK